MVPTLEVEAMRKNEILITTKDSPKATGQGSAVLVEMALNTNHLLVMVASKNVKTIDLLTRFISHMET
jgi:hypothetical protein